MKKNDVNANTEEKEQYPVTRAKRFGKFLKNNVFYIVSAIVLAFVLWTVFGLA